MDELDPSLAWAILALTLVAIDPFAGSFPLLALGAAAFGAGAMSVLDKARQAGAARGA